MTDSTSMPSAGSLVGKLLVASSVSEDPVLAESVSLVVHQDSEHVVAVLLNRPMSPDPAALLQILGNSASNGGSGHLTDGNAVQMDSVSESSLVGDSPEGHESDEGDFGGVPPKSHGSMPSNLDRLDQLAHQAERTVAHVSRTVGKVHFGGPNAGPVVAIHNSSDHAEVETGDGVYVAAQKQILESLVRTRPGPFRLIVGNLAWTWPSFLSELHAGKWHLIDATSEAVFFDDREMWANVIRRATSSSMARWVGLPDVPHAAMLN